jgi:hypothetical protein
MRCDDAHAMRWTIDLLVWTCESMVERYLIVTWLFSRGDPLTSASAAGRDDRPSGNGTQNNYIFNIRARADEVTEELIDDLTSRVLNMNMNRITRIEERGIEE